MNTTPRMKSICAALLAAAGCAGAAQAASITIYKQPNFTGDQVTLSATTPSLAPHNIMDQASSLVVDGQWEVCTQPNFAGDCRVLAPGRYATLEQVLNHRLESVRPAESKRVTYDANRQPLGRDVARRDDDRRDTRREDDRLDARRDEDRREARRDDDRRDGRRYDDRRYDERRDADRWRERGVIEIFPGADFRGRGIRIDRDAATLEQLTDRGSSVIVHEGTWQLCSETFYEGRCRTFEPGRYASLGRLDNSVASAKLVR